MRLRKGPFCWECGVAPVSLEAVFAASCLHWNIPHRTYEDKCFCLTVQSPARIRDDMLCWDSGGALWELCILEQRLPSGEHREEESTPGNLCIPQPTQWETKGRSENRIFFFFPGRIMWDFCGQAGWICLRFLIKHFYGSEVRSRKYWLNQDCTPETGRERLKLEFLSSFPIFIGSITEAI